MGTVVRSYYVLLFLLLAVSGCQTAPNIKDLGQLQQTDLQQHKSLVFGRITWVENGEEKTTGSGLFTFSLSPQLVRIEDKTRIKAEIDETGHFTWALEKGIYVINRIGYRDPWSGNYVLVPKVAFKVPETGRVYCIGNLRIDHTPKRDLIGGMSGKVKFSVAGCYDSDFQTFQERFARQKSEIQVALMAHDARLPQTLDTTAEFGLAFQILNGILFGIK